MINAGVIAHRRLQTADPVVAFVSLGAARKLADLRRHAAATVVFRSAWEWTAVEGTTELVGPRDRPPWVSNGELLKLIHAVYAAAAGGQPEESASLDESFEAEGHTVVLLTPTRVYPQ